MKTLRVCALPVVVEAIRILPHDPDDLDSVADEACRVAQFLGHGIPLPSAIVKPGSFAFRSRGGAVVAAPGDWIIRDICGEFHSCCDEVFRRSYVETDSPLTRSSP